MPKGRIFELRGRTVISKGLSWSSHEESTADGKLENIVRLKVREQVKVRP